MICFFIIVIGKNLKGRKGKTREGEEKIGIGKVIGWRNQKSCGSIGDWKTKSKIIRSNKVVRKRKEVGGIKKKRRWGIASLRNGLGISKWVKIVSRRKGDYFRKWRGG